MILKMPKTNKKFNIFGFFASNSKTEQFSKMLIGVRIIN